jgi:TatD DNase family protein
MYYIDTHAHIYSKDFKKDLNEMLDRTRQANVQKVVMPNIDHASIEPMMEIELKDPSKYFSTIGLHPCSVKKGFEKELYIVEQWLTKRKFKAIGEMGTDLHWDKTHFEEQKEAFRIQANWAKKYKLPLIIHCRESIDETIVLLEELKDDQLFGVCHCFSGSYEQAQRIIELGFYLGIGGAVTFKNSGLDVAIKDIDLKHLVLETDSPYLAPVPYRAKRNETSYIPIIAEKIAQIKETSVEIVQETTTQNSEMLFKI